MKTASLLVDTPHEPRTATLITEHELKVLITALAMVTPTGSGGAELVLLQKLQTATGMDSDDAMLRRYCNNFLEESEEAGMIPSFDRY